MTRNFCWLAQVCAAFALIILSGSPAWANLSFPPARNKDGSPDRRRGAGSRAPGESCLPQIADGEDETRSERVQFALNPVSNEVLTTSAAASFFWYMPAVTNGSVVFELLDSETQETVYRTAFLASETEGLAQLKLPSSAGVSLLEEGKRYDWSVLIICDPAAGFDQLAIDSQSATYKFTSQIKRVALSPELSGQLQVASSLQQAKLYTESGLWENGMSALVQARCNPATRDDSLTALTELLKSVDLEYFAQIPFFDSCDCVHP